MPEGGILLDLTSCRDWGMVQDAIRRAFGFPAHYGENWVAMWDCLTGLFWVPGHFPLPIFNDMWDTLWRQGPDLSKRRKAFVRPGGAVL